MECRPHVATAESRLRDGFPGGTYVHSYVAEGDSCWYSSIRHRRQASASAPIDPSLSVAGLDSSPRTVGVISDIRGECQAAGGGPLIACDPLSGWSCIT